MSDHRSSQPYRRTDKFHLFHSLTFSFWTKFSVLSSHLQSNESEYSGDNDVIHLSWLLCRSRASHTVWAFPECWFGERMVLNKEASIFWNPVVHWRSSIPSTHFQKSWLSELLNKPWVVEYSVCQVMGRHCQELSRLVGNRWGAA